MTPTQPDVKPPQRAYLASRILTVLGLLSSAGLWFLIPDHGALAGVAGFGFVATAYLAAPIKHRTRKDHFTLATLAAAAVVFGIMAISPNHHFDVNATQWAVIALFILGAALPFQLAAGLASGKLMPRASEAATINYVRFIAGVCVTIDLAALAIVLLTRGGFETTFALATTATLLVIAHLVLLAKAPLLASLHANERQLSIDDNRAPQ